MRVGRRAHRALLGFGSLLLLASSESCGGRSVLDAYDRTDGGSAPSSGGATDQIVIPATGGYAGSNAGGAFPIGSGGVTGQGGTVFGSGGLSYADASVDSGAGGVTQDAGVEGGGGTSPVDAGGQCTGQQVSCGGECVDPTYDPEHCGACGHGCLGGGCSASRCQANIIISDAWPIGSDIEATETHAYVLTNDAVTRFPHDLSTGGEQLASGSRIDVEIAVAGDFVYWASLAEDAIQRIPLSGGDPETVAPAGRNPRDLFANSQGVFWTNQLVGSSAIWMLPTAGGDAVQLASDLELAFDVVADSEAAYFLDSQANIIGRVPFSGGEPELLATGQQWAKALWVYSENVYFTRLNPPTVSRVSVQGGAVDVLLTDVRGWEIAVDDSGIYVGTDSGLVRASLDGTNVDVIAGAPYVGALALTDTAVYFLSEVGLSRVAK